LSCSTSSKRAADQRQLSVLSPAKVNLFFQILHKREDGFHEIASLYQAIDLCDTLHIALSEEDRFFCSEPSLLMDESNLVIRALRLFRKKTGNTIGFDIRLEKNIPMQAGLGGGSSNAASALRAFCQLADEKIGEEELKILGGQLGSDVPFFFSSGSAFATGRGEVLQEVPSPDLPSSFWIAKPSIGLSTVGVYKACRSNHFSQKDPQNSLKSFYSKDPSFYNDLEPAAFFLEPSLQDIKQDLLGLGFETVLLSGSGSAFFCLGNLSNPALSGVEFFKVRPIKNTQSEWDV
jgi:4-diphosphocytidyl-2-C-methyl-D-erythritol kinase